MPNGASSTSHKKTGGGSSKKVSTASPSSSRKVSSGGSKGGRKGGANTRPTTKNASAKGGTWNPTKFFRKNTEEQSELSPEKAAKETLLADQRTQRKNAGIQTFGDRAYLAKEAAKKTYGDAKQTFSK